MKHLHLLLIILCLSFPLFANSNDWKNYAIIFTECKDYSEVANAEKYIRQKGGSIAIIGSKNVMLGWIDPTMTNQLVGNSFIKAIYYNPIDLSTLPFYDQPTIQAAAFFNSVASGNLEKQKLKEKSELINKTDHFDCLLHPVISYDDYIKNLDEKNLDLQNLKKKNQLLTFKENGELLTGNSDKMVGTISVALFFVQSNGAIDQNLYTWSSKDENSMYQQTLNDLSWWSSMAMKYGKSVSFNIIPHYHTDPVCQQPYEPVLHSTNEDNLWIGSIMSNLGFQVGSHLSRAEAYNTWLRSTYYTDWAYSIFFAYNPSPAPSSFTNNYGGYAYLGGPLVQLLYSWYLYDNMTVAHETGHIFWAPDEYSQPGYGGCFDGSMDTKSGFPNGNCEYSNQNSVDCMMKTMDNILCAYTPAHIGWIKEVPKYIVDTNPSGLLISIENKVMETPQTFPWGKDSKIDISTVTPQNINGKRYDFLSWNDNGAQSHTINISDTATGYIANFSNTVTVPPTWSLYQKSNALPSPVVRAVALDMQNNILVGTLGGLSKFDGINWITYNTGNSGISANCIDEVSVDAKGTYWIVTTAFGDSTNICQSFDGTTWTIFNTSNSGLPSNRLGSIVIDKSGNKWFTTWGGGIAKFDGKNWTVFNTSNSGLPDNYILSMLIDGLGNIWVGTYNGLAKFDGTHWKVYTSTNSGLPGNYVFSMAEDGLGNIWMGTDNGLAKFDGTNWTVYNTSNSGLTENYLNSINTDVAGNKWIVTLSGVLVKFDGTNWTVYNKSNSGIHNNQVSSLMIDRSGNKWIGTSTGLVKFDDVNWDNYTITNVKALPANYIYSITIDKLGNKWIATDQGGLAKFDGLSWTDYNTSNSGLPDNTIRSIAIDSSGNRWIGTSSMGLVKFDGTSWKVYNTSNSGLPENSIMSIAIDSLGNKWIGTQGGLVKFDGINWTVYNISNSGLPQNQVKLITIDKNGNKWIGTNSGFAKFDNTKWAVYNTSNSSLPNNDIYSIAIDKSDNKWIGYGVSGSPGSIGLAKFDNTNWTFYTTSNSGLPDNMILSIAIDNKGNKWIGTLNGIAKFDDTHWSVYNTSNSSLPFNEIGSIAIDGSGNKWIGTYNGLIVFNNEGLSVTKIPAKPQLLMPIANQPREIILKWNKIKDALKYLIWLSIDQSFGSIIKSDSTVVDTTRLFDNLSEGQKYFWKVLAKNIAGTGQLSDIQNFTTTITPPSDLTLQRSGLNEITLKWNDNSKNEEGYIIERKQLPQINYTFLDSIKTIATTYLDTKVEQGQTYFYRLKAYTKFIQSDYTNETSLLLTGIENKKIPTEYSLSQNFPNPFNPNTKIKFGLPENTLANLTVYDVLGRVVKILINRELNAGFYEITFDGRNLSSGVYFYKLFTSKFASVKKLLLIK